MLLKEVLKELVESEDSASELYEKIAEVNEGEVEKTARVFSKQEQQHALFIQSIMDQLESLEEPLKPEVEQLMILYREEELTHSIIAAASRKQLFRHALKMERNSITLYEELSRHFDAGTIGRKHFEKLVAEERTHMYFILRQLHELE